MTERREASEQLVKNFSDFPEKKQAWYDLIGLMLENDYSVRLYAARALIACYSQIPEEYKKQAMNYLHRFAQDNNYGVRMIAAQALGVYYYHSPEVQFKIRRSLSKIDTRKYKM